MDELEEIEAALRRDLRHVPAPPNFAAGVAARIAKRRAGGDADAKREQYRLGILTIARSRTAWWTAAAAAMALAVGGGNIRHQRQQREATAALAQVDLAMQLTSHALNEVGVGLGRSSAGRFTQLLNGTQR